MRHLGLSRALSLPGKAIVTFYGAGGKTTLMLALARELANAGQRVVITTTTRIFRPRNKPEVMTQNPTRAYERLKDLLDKGSPVFWGKGMAQDKLVGVPPSWIEEMFENFSSRGNGCYILVEADGAAGKPIKGYGGHEPVIPLVSHHIIPVLGADALGGKLGERAHRPEKLASALGRNFDWILTPRDLAGTVSYMVDIGKKQAPKAQITAIVNKIDLFKHKLLLQELGRELEKEIAPFPFLFTEAKDKNPVKFAFAAGKPFPLVSCIILAAGLSRRMDKDKLCLTLGGKTLLQRTVEGVLQTDVDELVVVRKPENFQEPMPFRDCRLKVVPNPDYTHGIASSLKAGLRGIHPHSQGALFALGDQPFIPPEVFNAILNRYKRYLKKVVYPTYQGKKGNPTLFDRQIWPIIEELHGDTGGRQVLKYLSSEDIDSLPLESPEILTDIDTPEDFLRVAKEKGLSHNDFNHKSYRQ